MAGGRGAGPAIPSRAHHLPGRHPQWQPCLPSRLAAEMKSPCCPRCPRCRPQVQGTLGRPVLYRGTMDCITQIARKEGLRGFYRAALPSYAKVRHPTLPSPLPSAAPCALDAVAARCPGRARSTCAARGALPSCLQRAQRVPGSSAGHGCSWHALHPSCDRAPCRSLLATSCQPIHYICAGDSELLPQGRCGQHLPPVSSAAGAGEHQCPAFSPMTRCCCIHQSLWEFTRVPGPHGTAPPPPLPPWPPGGSQHRGHVLPLRAPDAAHG